VAARREPIFLGRETYRRRRLIDAMRLLPMAGGILFLLPLLGGSGAQRSTALGGLYLFLAWFGIILVAAVLVRALARAPGGVGSDPLEPHTATPPNAEETAGIPEPGPR